MKLLDFWHHWELTGRIVNGFFKFVIFKPLIFFFHSLFRSLPRLISKRRRPLPGRHR